MRVILLTAVLFFGILNNYATAQTIIEHKKVPAQRTTALIKIDGVPDDEAWKAASVITNFIEWRPNAGKPEEATNRTEIKILYDNVGIYIAGYCHERTVDSVAKELIGRDNVGVNDFVGVMFDTYHDQINGFGFYVTPLGEQFDAKYSNDGEDGSWSAVWDSESKLVKDGWTFEMRIPYSAIRFNSKPNQTWGLNITRRRNKTGQQYMWNPVDPKVNGFFTQFGEWTNIEKIESPVRLQFSPYLSTYVNHYPLNQPGVKNTSVSVNGGMDVKYGINDSYTLDMTLIPDFGQVQSDNQILNLTPFEVRYNENRSFFTEGTELFNKGNLFYSRRIGGAPIHQYDVESTLQTNEHIVKNPTETKLLNATKISGRNKKGLGMGFFNAITKPTYATIEDDKGVKRKVETNPFTNYNIVVLDQTLKHNSSVSFINTNTMRNGIDYDANVSAGLFNLFNKTNKYNVGGKFAYSQLFNKYGDGKNIGGYSHNLYVGKVSGRFNFQFTQELVDDKYDQGDMGYLTNNNYLDHYLWMSYRWLKPTKWYNRIQANFNTNYSRRFKPSDYQNLNINVNTNFQFKNLWWAGFFADYQFQENDFYEPRVAGRVFKRPSSNGVNLWVETNGAKKYSVSASTFGRYRTGYGNAFGYNINMQQRYRFNDHLSISYEFNVDGTNDNLGYAYQYNSNNVIFSRRARVTVENVVGGKYNFNNKMGLTIRVRHYWSKVAAKEFYDLQKDGSLLHNSSFTENVNQNFNAFNVDMVYTWQIAPGSFINIVWKDAIYDFNQDVQYGYIKNLNRTLDVAQNNSLSVRIIYFLDYLQFKKKK